VALVNIASRQHVALVNIASRQHVALVSYLCFIAGFLFSVDELTRYHEISNRRPNSSGSLMNDSIKIHHDGFMLL
jgi:hypothetical protein